MTTIIDYSDHKIEIDSDCQFKINGGPTISDEEYKRRTFPRFDSLRQAKAEIDNRIKLAHKTARVKQTFKVEMLDGYGYHAMIRGINANTSDLLADKIDGSRKRDETHGIAHHDEFYPDVSAVRDILLERTRLEDRIGALEQAIGKLAIRVSRGYGRIALEYYDAKLLELQQEIAAKTEAAEKVVVPPK